MSFEQIWYQFLWFKAQLQVKLQVVIYKETFCYNALMYLMYIVIIVIFCEDGMGWHLCSFGGGEGDIQIIFDGVCSTRTETHTLI